MPKLCHLDENISTTPNLELAFVYFFLEESFLKTFIFKKNYAHTKQIGIILMPHLEPIPLHNRNNICCLDKCINKND